MITSIPTDWASEGVMLDHFFLFFFDGDSGTGFGESEKLKVPQERCETRESSRV